jgi:hypothetical protein
MTEFQLVPPRPDQSPQTATQSHDPSARLFQWPDIVEKTVQAVVEDPSGPRSGDVQAVIVFTDGTWLTVGAEGGSDDERAYLNTGNSWDRSQLSDFLSADELLGTGLINDAQHQFLANREAELRKKDAAARAARLRAEADRLEGGAA